MTSVNADEREQTRRLVERIVAGELGRCLRAQVAARHSGASAEEAEEAFQEAYVGRIRRTR